ncbi:TPA: O6 family O-antigen polymerase, partial [Escherichia coli]|nr:O6 family O-antigen polymerase [Escherichia coli]HCT7839748.1 O6 family O-antigen polymerase [Escherichia coli]HDS9135029.1 O6 family O-antigen polymerase [Escherichia coli]HDT0676572.1 O6 family O-antigen polymerase [Escherichia coli]HDT5679843.1 O6 family O-antigen polymerase [Escherichia coli]
SFFLICAFHIQFRTNKKFLFIAICIAAFSTLKGSRSEAITFLLTVTCIYFNEVKTRNLRLLITMIFVFSVIFVISEFISMWRTGGSFFQLMQGNNPVINFVYGMGVSYLSIYQSVKLQLLSGGYNVTYLFSQLIITCSSIFNVKLSLPEISYSHLASYTANPELYNLGFGLGGSYLAESFLAFGLIGCFIIPFLLLLNLNVLEKYTKNKPIIYFVYYSVLPPILFTPRETLFYFFPYLVKSIFVAFLVTLYIQYKKD